MFKFSLCFLLLFSFFSFNPVNANDDEQAFQEAYGSFVQSADNLEILEYAEDKWGDDYIMIQHEYYNQLEALNWIEQQPNSEEILREGREEFDNDYSVMRHKHERDMVATENVAEFIGFLFLTIVLFNFFFLLFFIKDILNRKERLVLWIPSFLVCAPVVSIFYRTFRKPKKGEKVVGTHMYNFAKSFLILWPISMVAAFIFFISAVLMIDWFGGQDVDSQFIGEALFWFGGIFACTVLPVIVIFPATIAALIMFLTKPTSKGDN